jgi:hypothetical protein
MKNKIGGMMYKKQAIRYLHAHMKNKIGGMMYKKQAIRYLHAHMKNKIGGSFPESIVVAGGNRARCLAYIHT